MTNPNFDTCPRCGAPTTAGFAHRSAGLSFVTPEKLDHFLFIDEDLAEAGWRKFLPAQAQFFRSYLCRACRLYLVDYSQALSRREAEQSPRPEQL
jgi:hypothetical protein